MVYLSSCSIVILSSSKSSYLFRELIDIFCDIPQFLRTNFVTFTLIWSLPLRSTHSPIYYSSSSHRLPLLAGIIVGILTRIRAGWSRVRISAVKDNFLLSRTVHIGFEAHSTHYSVGNGVLPLGKGGWGVMLSTPVPSSFKSKHSLQHPKCRLNFMWQCCV